jgi:hypothetical protein
LSNLALLGALVIAGCATSERAPYTSGDEVSNAVDHGGDMATLDGPEEASPSSADASATWAHLSATTLTATLDDEQSTLANDNESDDLAPVEPGEENDENSTANFFVYLKAVPADYDQVWVDISGVDVGTTDNDAGTWTATMSNTRSIDLLTLQSEPTILGDVELQPGSYAQMRLFLSNPKIVSGTEYLPVFTQAALRSGIEIDLNFEVEEGVAYSLVLDFDALASFQEDGLGIHLRPVIRVDSFTSTDGSSVEPAPTSADAGAPAFVADAG